MGGRPSELKERPQDTKPADPMVSDPSLQNREETLLRGKPPACGIVLGGPSQQTRRRDPSGHEGLACALDTAALCPGALPARLKQRAPPPKPTLMLGRFSRSQGFLLSPWLLTMIVLPL